MHCTQCGNQLAPGTRFCPNCGAAVADTAAPFGASSQPYGQQPYSQTVPPPPPGAGVPPPPPPATHTLLRPRHGRMVAGVCAAFALAYGWNVTLVRILLVLSTPLHLGLGIIGYIVAWIVIPEEPYLLTPAGRV